MAYRVTGLDPAPFLPFYGLPEAELASRGVLRRVADCCPGFPDRVELRDARPGEALLLLNFTHLPEASPYRASHAIFVLEGATRRHDAMDAIPDPLLRRPISLRAFDAAHLLLDADLAEGAEVEATVLRLLDDPRVAYVHAHYAKPGCYAARVTRD